MLPPGHIGFHGQDTALDLLHRLVRGDGENVDGEHEAAGEVRQLGNHIVLEERCQVFEEQHPANLAAHLKVSGLKGKAVRADEVAEVQPTADSFALVKGEILFLAGAEKVVEDTQTVIIGDSPRAGVQPSKALGKVALHPAEVGAGVLNFPLGDGQGDKLVLHQIVALGHLVQQDLVGLPAVLVQPVALFFHQDGALEVLKIQPAVADGDFGGSIRRQGVQHAAVGEEDGAAVIV